MVKDHDEIKVVGLFTLPAAGVAGGLTVLGTVIEAASAVSMARVVSVKIGKKKQLGFERLRTNEMLTRLKV